MRNTIIIIVLAAILFGVFSAPTKYFCPVTKITDPTKCFDCHSPDKIKDFPVHPGSSRRSNLVN